jgi:putative zinc finger protein
MKTPPGHPELLLWHAAGSLDPEQAAAVARHLEQCGECRRDAETFGSLGGTIRTAGGTGHVSAEDLVRFEQEALARDPRSREAIERHLAACADCRADLDALAGARSPATGPDDVTRPGRRPARRAWTAVAAAAAAVVIAGALIAPRLESWRGGDPRITFSAPRRGAQDERVLTTGGPWTVTVLLPYDAPAGTYDVRVERDTEASPGGALTVGATRAEADRDLRLVVPIGPIAAPGFYRLIAAAEGPAASSPYVYSFRVLPAASGDRRTPGR